MLENQSQSVTLEEAWSEDRYETEYCILLKILWTKFYTDKFWVPV